MVLQNIVQRNRKTHTNYVLEHKDALHLFTRKVLLQYNNVPFVQAFHYSIKEIILLPMRDITYVKFYDWIDRVILE
jgi:hypothetical protein